MIVNLITRSYRTSEADPDDPWDRPNTGEEFEGLEVNPPGREHPDYNGLEVPDDTRYVVGVKYETGDTFGADERHTLLEGFTDLADAQAMVDFLRRKYGGWDLRARTVEFEFEFNGKKYYADWEGYFERFLFAWVEPLDKSEPYGYNRKR